MKNLRIISAGALAVIALSLAACGDDSSGDDKAAAGTSTAPSATATAAPSPVPSTVVPALGDRELCQTIAASGKDLKKDLFATMDANGNLPPAKTKVIITKLGAALTTAAAAGSGEVAAAVTALGAETTKAGASADPAKALEGSGFQQAATKVDAACTALGVDPNFS